LNEVEAVCALRGISLLERGEMVGLDPEAFFPKCAPEIAR
jgi:hypothetical protein